MSEEILNLDHHKKILVVKALNRHRTMSQAAAALQMTERNLYHLKKQYKVQNNNGHFLIPGFYEMDNVHNINDGSHR